MMYLLLVNAALSVGFGLYQLCFRKLTFFEWNRFYLLGMVAVSMLVPVGLFIDLSSLFAKDEIIPYVNLTDVMDIMYVPMSIEETSYNLMDLLIPIYWSGIVLFFIRLVYRLFSVYKAFTTREVYVSFSFFNKAYLGSKVIGVQAIDQHEKVHMNQGHSYDIVFLELVCLLNWFNPIVYLIRKELKFQHECIADELCSDDRIAYAELLVANAMRTDSSNLVHEFSNQSFLKKRIMMLFKNKSSNNKRLLYLTGVPVLVTVVFSTIVFNTSRAKEVVADLESTISDVKIAKSDAIFLSDEKLNAVETIEPDMLDNVVGQQEEVVEIPEIFAEPKGGMIAFRKWIGENYQYPQKAIDAGIKGIIQVGFIVEKDGSLSHIMIKEGIGYGADEAALSLLEKSPKWSPAINRGKSVRTAFLLPIRLDLTDAGITEEEKNTVFVEVENEPQPAKGMAAFRQWIGDHYQYPEGAIDAGVKGTIWVQFIVEKDGTLSNIKKTEDLGYGTGEAAVSLLLKSPKWNPGIQNGHVVRVAYKLPIRLDLTNM